MAKFIEFNLSPPIMQAISKMGFEEATHIQEEAIPLALSGSDLIGQAPTGTGKTVAFGIPMMEQIPAGSTSLQGLVITPTRELAIQVAEELNRVGEFKGFRTLPIYGGQEIGQQFRALSRNPQVVVGTPGRLLDHIRRRTIKLDLVQFVVLDEADEMLDMGFIEDIEQILEKITSPHQTMLFSATMPLPIQKLAARFQNNPVKIQIKRKELTVESIEQFYIELSEKQKFDVLCRLLDIDSPSAAIVFGRTKRRVDELFEALNKRGYDAEALHGDLSQPKRNTVLRRFRDGNVDILVATDVAARGLDISGVTHVYNFDLPQDPESYVHRVGRTGRAGRSGSAMTFITPREKDHLRIIEEMTHRKIIRRPTPTVSEALLGQQRLSMEKLLQMAQEDEANRYTQLAQDLLDQGEPVKLLAAALRLLTREPNITPINLTAEAPLRAKTPSNKGRKPPFKGQTRRRTPPRKN